MLEPFYPTVLVPSVYELDFEQLYADGYRGILFDIDNTLVHHGAPADERAMALFDRLRRIGFDFYVLSNNDEARVKMFTDAVDVRYIYKAHKPKPDAYIRAMETMGLDRAQTLFIGDQMFTDIWGANRAGVHTIMVRYLYWREEIQIFFKRRLETMVKIFYRLYCRRQDPEDPESAAYWLRRYGGPTGGQ